MIPKQIEILQDNSDRWTGFFSAYYFGKKASKNLDLSDHESDQNRIFREWLLGFKDLVNKSGNPIPDYRKTPEFTLFRYLLIKFISNQIILRPIRDGDKIGLIHVPGHLKNSKNSIKLVIEDVCQNNNSFIDLTDTIYRSRQIAQGSDIDEKKDSLEWRTSELNKLENIDFRTIIIVDDIYTQGRSIHSIYIKLNELGEHPLNSRDKNIYAFFTFGKTLTTSEIRESEFSNSEKEILLPEKSEIHNKDHINIFEQSIKNNILSDRNKISINKEGYWRYNNQPPRFISTNIKERPTPTPTPYSKPQTIFKIGSSVKHETFGKGVILDMSFSDYDQKHLAHIKFLGLSSDVWLTDDFIEMDIYKPIFPTWIKSKN